MGETRFSLVVEDLTTNTTVKANASTADMKDYDFEKNNTNTGAGGAIVLTLPAAASLTGKKTRIQLTVAQTVTLTPQTGEKIFLGGDGVASKYLLIAGTIGNYAEVYCDGTSFYVTGYSGVLTKEG
jgi:hypothetical protein